MYQDVPGEDQQHVPLQAARTPDAWAQPEEAEVFVFPRYNWWNNIVPIASIDRQKREITLAGDASYAIRPGDRYFVQNLLEELDAPGEWYLDRTHVDALLLAADAAGRATGLRADAGTILELGPGTAHVVFRGFTFECCEGTAVMLDGTRALPDRRQHDPQRGRLPRQRAWPSNGGYHNGVVGNDISEVGSHGIVARRRRPQNAHARRELRRQQLHPPHRRLLQAGRGRRA